jgi:hypothetical protein
MFRLAWNAHGCAAQAKKVFLLQFRQADPSARHAPSLAWMLGDGFSNPLKTHTSKYKSSQEDTASISTPIAPEVVILRPPRMAASGSVF